MRTASAITLAVLLSCTAAGAAQDPLEINQTVEREILPGTAHSYTIELRAGDYVAGNAALEGVKEGTGKALAVLDGGVRSQSLRRRR